MNSDISLHRDGHMDHGPQWNVQIDEDCNATCLACVVEFLEDQETLLVKKRLVLTDFMRLLGYHGDKVIPILLMDMRVTVHTSLILLDLMKVSDDTFITLAAEVLSQLLFLVGSDDLLQCVLESASREILRVCNYKKSLPFFNLLGRLLHEIPLLIRLLLDNFGSLVDYLCAGLGYPDESIQVSLCYVFFHLYNRPAPVPLPGPLNSQLVTNVLELLTRARSHELQMNALGLMKVMLSNPSLVELYMKQSKDGPSFSSALKSVMLGRTEMLQVAAVQCVMALVNSGRGQQWVQKLLQEDVAEFLYEALPTTNELLIGSIFCCLLLFTESEVFFRRYHSVYGIEAVLRAQNQALKLGNRQVIIQGFHLLSNVLQKHCSGVRLFSQPAMVSCAVQLVEDGIKHQNQAVFSQAAACLANLLRRDHLGSPVPVDDLESVLSLIDSKLAALPRMTCCPDMVGTVQSSKSKKDIAKGRARVTQQHLISCLLVIERAWRLAECCKLDPTCAEQTFSAPAPNIGQGTLEHKIYHLLLEITEHAVPVVMSNVRHVSDVRVFTCLFSCLNFLGQLCPNQCPKFYHKLAGTGFLQVLLTVKCKYRDEVKEVANHLLTTMCCHLLVTGHSQTMQDDVKEVLAAGFPGVQGDVHSLSHLLAQNSVCPTDLQLQYAQWSSICLIFLTLNSGERVNMKQLAEAVSSFLCLYNDLYCTPPSLLKYLVYICAATSYELKLEQGVSRKSVQVLVEGLKSQKSVETWCLPHVLLLYWVFSDPELAVPLGSQVVEFWLSLPEQDNGTDLYLNELSEREQERGPGVENPEALMALASNNHLGLKALLTCHLWNVLELLHCDKTERLQDVTRQTDVLCSESPCVNTKVTDVLRNVIGQCDDTVSENEVAAILKNHLLDTLLKLLLRQDGQKTFSHILKSHLDMVCLVKQHWPLEPLIELDLKLAYHVSKMISLGEQEPYSPQLISAMNLLTCLLSQSDNQNKNTVVSVLLSNQDLLVLIEDILKDHPDSHPLSLLTRMMQLQHQHNIHVDKSICINANAMLQRLLSKDVGVRLSGLQFWNAYLSTKGKSKLVSLVPSLHQTGEFSSAVLETLVIYLQQSVVSPDCLIQQAAVSCFLSALDYYEDHAELSQHLWDQPWNIHMIRISFFTSEYLDSKSPLLQLCSKLLQYNPDMVKPAELQCLLEEFCKSDQDSKN